MSLKPSLETLDFLDLDAIACAFAADSYPLSGIASHLDWRLCGLLTNLFRSKQFQGKAQESLLLSPNGRIKPNRIFLFGWGASEDMPKTFASELQHMVQVLSRAKAKSVAIAVPDGSEAAYKGALALMDAKLPFQLVGVFKN